MHTLFQDVRYALRMLVKNPGFSAIAILSLAMAFGATIAIFTVVNAILLNPLPVKDISRVVEIDTIDSKTRVTAANATKLGMSYMNFQDYARQTQLFSAMTCLVGPLPVTWSGGAEPRQLQGQMVSASYFDLLGLRPAAGRFFLPDEDTKPGGNNVAVLSYSLWTNKFCTNPNIVAQNLTLNATPYTVIGVSSHAFKGTFTFLNAQALWIPVSGRPGCQTRKRNAWYTLLKVSRETADSRATRVNRGPSFILLARRVGSRVLRASRNVFVPSRVRPGKRPGSRIRFARPAVYAGR